MFKLAPRRTSTVLAAGVVAMAMLSSAVSAQATAASAPSVPAARPAASDSAEVAATVLRYHEALGRGDSSAAIALLSPDAVILETGALETVAE